MAWHDGALTMGQAARLGDKLQITQVSARGRSIWCSEINGGLKTGGKWVRPHVQVGMGGMASLGNANNRTASLGTWIQINFHKADGVSERRRSETNSGSGSRFRQSVPPPCCTPRPRCHEMQQAVKEKRAMVGMDREQVAARDGTPRITNIASRSDWRVESEDWIYGAPPGRSCSSLLAAAR